ncbi:MAG: hypothetical protein GXX96_04725 [Planctomycetaceae bacterium]|nr:hypothetical protein [Planctomycetaceae bacterium]
MDDTAKPGELGLELVLQHPTTEDATRIPTVRGENGAVLYPELDGDGDHVHFEMVPMQGTSLLWITIRREIPPAAAAQSLRKIADLIDRHGGELLSRRQGDVGSFGSDGRLVDGPLRLGYNEHGDMVIPK